MNVLSRARSPERERALKIWLDSDRQKRPKDIAIEMNISDSIIRKWKSLDKWENIPLSKRKGRGAAQGNNNAKGNKGGVGGPVKNDNAVKHGLFRKFLPDDPNYLEIFDASEHLSPLEMLWSTIRIAWVNIIQAQEIQFVKDKHDVTKVLTKYAEGKFGDTKEWEYQHAWDKKATALTSQSTAMNRLASMIRHYDAKLRDIPPEEVLEEQRLRIEKLKAEVKSLGNTGNGIDNGNIDQLTEAIQKSAASIRGDH